MALLLVQAQAEDGPIAEPGNRGRALVAVSVTDSAGIPVTGLGVANFRVDPMVVGAGGSLVNITAANPVRLPGTYLVEVVPNPAGTWRPGVYIFAVAVERGPDRGQALCSMLLD